MCSCVSASLMTWTEDGSSQMGTLGWEFGRQTVKAAVDSEVLWCVPFCLTLVYKTPLLDASRLSSQPFELCKLVRYCDVTKFFALLSPLP